MSTVADYVAELTRAPSILVIDDDYLVRFIFGRLASTYDIQLDCVSTPEEGIDHITSKMGPSGQSGYDAVFLDMKFENGTHGSAGMSGMDVLRRINLLDYNSRVIVMSGSINLHDVMHEANKLGVLSFMAKPIDFTVEFLAAILRRLGIRLSLRQQVHVPEI